jgi:hypothetical protein
MLNWGMFRISLLFLSVLTVAGHVNAQPKSLCDLVTAGDAQGFFGKAADKIMGNPQICSYGLKGQDVMLTAVNYTSSRNAKQLFEMNRHALEQQKGSSPKDEPGLGATAFSTSTKNAVLIFLLKGNATVQLTANTAEGKQVPAGFLDKLRVVAKKAAGRM